MADNKKTDNKGMRKFKFVEDFIDPQTGMRYPDVDSPKMQYPKNFHPFLGHQIAKIVYKEKRVVQYKTKIDKFGNTVKGDPEVIVTYDEVMGDKGGWIERMENLSQGGECWVEKDGMVLDDAFIRDDAIVGTGGEVGDNAIVGGKARVIADAGVGGSAYLYDNAIVDGAKRIAVSGRARVAGKVTGSAIVLGDARVLEKGVVSGDAAVHGAAQVYGSVSGIIVTVTDNAIVYGSVTGLKVRVYGNAFIGKEGEVRGKLIAVGDDAVVYGKVKDGSDVIESAFIEKGGEIDTSTVSGHAYVNGVVKQKSGVGGNAWLDVKSTVTDGYVRENGTVSQKGRVSNTVVDGNGRVGISSGVSVCSVTDNAGLHKCNVRGGILLGNTTVLVGGQLIYPKQDSGCMIAGEVNQLSCDGASLIAEKGSVTGGNVKGGSVVDGTVAGGVMDGSAVLGEGGTLSGSMKDNSHAAVSVRGGLSGNGAAGVSTPQGATGNGVIMSAEIGASENQVSLEPNDKRPGAAAVICKVEKE